MQLNGRVIVILTILMLLSSISGCIRLDENKNEDNGDMGVPTWEIGDWWLYTFSTPDYSDDTARLVVASDEEEGDTAYMLAISSITEAKRHSVLNHNPFLGRMTHANLSTFENGIPQNVLSFPFSKSNSWTFSLFTEEWSATVIDVEGGKATVSASSPDGSKIDYVFDMSLKFFSSFIWKNPDGVEQLRMSLADYGANHTGEVFFVRGGDLYNGTWIDSGIDLEIRDSFFVDDHPNDGEWDEMVYFIDAECGSGASSITLTLRDHLSISALERFWGPGATEKGTLGSIPYPTEEYTLTATFTGSASLRIIIAGAITQSWTL